MGKLLYPCQKRQAKLHPEWSYNSVIYELNVRQFTCEGTFLAASKHLPRLKSIGFDLIWLMPIYPIGELRRKGSLGSYYSVRDYTAVNPEFGTYDDFNHFVDTAHQLGIRVILDWIPNHTSRDAIWTKTHPEYYVWDNDEIATPFDWDDTAQLDYNNPQLRRAMIDSMAYWLDNTAIDGFRVDMAMLVPMDFWQEAIPELEQKRNGIFMLAEAQGEQFHRCGYDATYSWDIHHLFNNIAQGKANAADLRNQLMREAMEYPTGAFRMTFTSNHDENSWNGTEFERMGGKAARCMAALSFILPSIPMVYNGQEVSSTKRLAFFEKDSIDWGELTDESGIEYEMTELYRELCRFRADNRVLWAGEMGGDLVEIHNTMPSRIFSVKREVDNVLVIAIFNLSDTGCDFFVNDVDFEGEFNELGNTAKAHFTNGQHYYLPSWGFYIYHKTIG